MSDFKNKFQQLNARFRFFFRITALFFNDQFADLYPIHLTCLVI